MRRENSLRINGTPVVMGNDEASDTLRERLRVLLKQSRRGACVRAALLTFRFVTLSGCLRSLWFATTPFS